MRLGWPQAAGPTWAMAELEGESRIETGIVAVAYRGNSGAVPQSSGWIDKAPMSVNDGDQLWRV